MRMAGKRYGLIAAGGKATAKRFRTSTGNQKKLGRFSAQRPDHRSCQSGLGNRYHLRFHGPWVYVPGGGHGLAQP
jgi:hypothetical protein